MTHKSHRQSVKDIHKLVAEQLTVKATKAVAVLLRTPAGTAALAGAAGLSIAYRLDDLATGQRLLDAGAQVGARGPDDTASPIEAAVRDRSATWFDLLIPRADRAAQIDALLAAIAGDDLDWVARVLDHVPDVHKVGHAGLTPLHAAALAGNVIIYDMIAARTDDPEPGLPEPAAIPAVVQAGVMFEPLAVPAGTRPGDLVQRVLVELRDQRAPASRLSLLETMAAHLARPD